MVTSSYSLQPYHQHYYPPWFPHTYVEAIEPEGARRDHHVNASDKVTGEIPLYGFTESRAGNDGASRAGDDGGGGETSLPNYYFFQFVMKFIKKMRRHFLPVYLTGPDISSIYTQYQEKR